MQHIIMRSALYSCLVYCTLVSQTGGAALYENNRKLWNPLVMLMSIDTRLKEQNEGNVCVFASVRACVRVCVCVYVRVRVGKQLLQTTIHMG